MAFPLTLLYVAISLLSPGIFPVEISNLHIQEVLGSLTLLACVFEVQGSSLFERAETYLMLGLILAASLSILVTGWIGGAIGMQSWFFPSVAPFFFITISCRSLKRLKVLVVVMVAAAIFIVCRGTAAQLSGEMTSPYLICEGCAANVPANTIMRSVGLGVLNDPNDLAQFLVALVPLLWLRWKKGSYAGNFFFTILPASVLLVGVYFTHSRGGTIALAAIILFGLKDKLGLIASAIVCGIGGAGALVLGITGGRGMADDDGGRVGLWYDALHAFISHPVFGVGARNFADYNHSLTAHNSYMLSLAETGLFGYFFWIGLLVVGWDGLTSRMNFSKVSEPDGAVEEGSTSLARSASFESRTAAFTPRLASHPGTSFVNGAWMQPSASLSFSPASYTKLPAVSDEDSIAFFARIFRLSLVGFLAAAFFLSRTYAMALYIVLGMAAALRSVGNRADLKVSVGKLLKKIWIVIFCSIIVLYIIIRIGLRH